MQDYCNCKFNYIELVGYNHLKKLEIGSNSLKYVEELILKSRMKNNELLNRSSKS